MIVYDTVGYILNSFSVCRSKIKTPLRSENISLSFDSFSLPLFPPFWFSLVDTGTTLNDCLLMMVWVMFAVAIKCSQYNILVKDKVTVVSLDLHILMTTITSSMVVSPEFCFYTNLKHFLYGVCQVLTSSWIYAVQEEVVNKLTSQTTTP